MKNRMVVWRIICRTGGEDGFELRRRLWLRGILQQARDEGDREFLRDLLLQLLRERFDPLPPETDERVDRASAPDLESWTENLIVAGTVDEVFAPNRQCLAAGWNGVGNSKPLASTT